MTSATFPLHLQSSVFTYMNHNTALTLSILENHGDPTLSLNKSRKTCNGILTCSLLTYGRFLVLYFKHDH